MIQIAVLGHGVVGSGVVEVLSKNGESIARKIGEDISVKYILDKRDFPDSPYRNKFVKDFNIILNDPDVRVVVEVMGGVSPAYDFVKASILAGKNAVSSNKEMVAQKGAELLALAREHDVNFLFEASVGGGIPIIHSLHQCLAANKIDEIAGILNGTTNFILTKMIKENMAFEDALALAQKNGYAEADPTADVEGLDACRKICILASLVFGSHVYPECIRTRGITKLTLEDVQFASSEHYVIKLIGRAYRDPSGKVFADVGPALIAGDSQLAGVDDVFNAILVRGDATGDVVFYGKGAGKLPTASAVVSDVIDCIKADKNIFSLFWADSDHQNIADCKDQPAQMYLRCIGDAGTVTEQFPGACELCRKAQPAEEHAFLTGEMTERVFEQKLQLLQQRGITVLAVLPVLNY